MTGERLRPVMRHAKLRRYQIDPGVSAVAENQSQNPRRFMPKGALMRWTRKTGRRHKKRDWEKLSPQYAKRMSAKVMEWKKTGQYQEIRRTAKLARGMPDHLAAKQWVVRNPYGKLYSFPNLNEWARQHEHLFKDTRPDSKQPFWLRISGGIRAVLAKRGKSCSYKGWVAVSKRELVEEAGYDLLQRDRAAPDA